MTKGRSRYEKLTRLLLIHWHYFTHETISFETLNFLTGKNASGKSTIIDAMQLVLLGDTSAWVQAMKQRGISREEAWALAEEMWEAEDDRKEI